MYIIRTFVYNLCTKLTEYLQKLIVYKMYTKCIQNVSHISSNFCLQFVYKIKRTMTAKICRQNI